MPRLLFLSQVLPYPPDRGVAIRTHHLLRILSQRFETHLLCFYRREAHEQHRVADCVASAPTSDGATTHPIPQEHSRFRFAWDHLRSLATQRPYTHFLYESKAFAADLTRLLSAEQFSLIHVDTLDLSRFLPRLPDVSVVCGHHNVEAELLRRRAAFTDNPFKSAYMRLQSELQRRELRRWAPRVTLNLTVSQHDCEVIRELAPDARIEVIPNGVDVDYFRSSDRESGQKIVFVGGTSWEPNRDAMEYFCMRVLPRLRQRLGDVSVTWVGRCHDQDRHRFSEEFGIELTGYVDDIRPYLEQASCYVVPLRVGGGTRLKILDAWAMGKAVVSTTVGCEGLDTVDGENILVRDGAASFADAVVNVLRNRVLRRRLGRNGRRTAEDLYSWSSIGEKLLHRYESLV